MANPITVPLPADLPTNWQQYQVVSPNGTEAGLSEQHGYNYLMEQVNNAQTAAKECGEALGNAAFADIEINGHPLTGDINLTASDVGARPNTWTPTAAQVGAVPTSRTVNGKQLTSNITLNAEDVGAAPSSHTHSAANITSGIFSTSRLPIIPTSKGGTGKSSWSANRLIYPNSSNGLVQMSFPSSAGSVLRQGTSGAPYWSSLDQLAEALGGCKIETGDYDGTGTYGNNNRNSLSFSFDPVLVFISRSTNSSNSAMFPIVRGASTTFTIDDDGMYSINLFWGDKSVEWYVASSDGKADNQMNQNHMPYYYVAIG